MAKAHITFEHFKLGDGTYSKSVFAVHSSANKSNAANGEYIDSLNGPTVSWVCILKVGYAMKVETPDITAFYTFEEHAIQ